MSRPVPATSATHGPFKKVAEIATRIDVSQSFGRARERRVIHEILECGHVGNILESDATTMPTWKQEMVKKAREKVANGKARRRCYSCRVPHCDWCGQPTTEDRPLTDRLPIYGANDGVHAECLAAYEQHRREEEEWTAKVREENLARRRAAGERV